MRWRESQIPRNLRNTETLRTLDIDSTPACKSNAAELNPAVSTLIGADKYEWPTCSDTTLSNISLYRLLIVVEVIPLLPEILDLIIQLRMFAQSYGLMDRLQGGGNRYHSIVAWMFDFITGPRISFEPAFQRMNVGAEVQVNSRRGTDMSNTRYRSLNFIIFRRFLYATST